jgi:alkylation response protein AidB-like acyl-CoA dehydrogenase
MTPSRQALDNLGSAPLAVMTSDDLRDSQVVARGPEARAAFLAGVEEWKLLIASALIGLTREALEMAARYATERTQFDQQIGSYQAIAHPLADAVIDVDGAELMLWRTLRAIADGEADAGAQIAMTFWWAARTASNAVARALHTFGGYGLTLEYDIQLYHRRAKAFALVLGDPAEELARAGRRMWTGETTALPDVGAVEIDFGMGPEADALAEETRAFFEKTLTPELRAKAHYSFEGHDWGVNKALGQARLLHPDWPEQWGGRDASHYASLASGAVWEEFHWGAHARGVNSMVGRIIMMFGAPELQKKVLPRIANGEIITSLGYSEPGSGSDIFAAKTRAVRDGDDWIVNGQKMFTSGAELASYVLLLTRTDPDVPKHRGLTLFLVPLDSPGVEVHPIHTFQDERTNATFYTDVRVSDSHRIGEINQGVRVMSAALTMEQGGGGYFFPQRDMLKEALDWAREGDGARLQRPDVLRRLAQVAAHAYISEALAARATFTSVEKAPDAAYGPAAKVFSTESFIKDATDLLDLTAPFSILCVKYGVGFIERYYRYSTATTIYAGTSEVLRSMVAERRLGLPRTRN